MTIETQQARGALLGSVHVVHLRAHPCDILSVRCLGSLKLNKQYNTPRVPRLKSFIAVSHGRGLYKTQAASGGVRFVDANPCISVFCT